MRSISGPLHPESSFVAAVQVSTQSLEPLTQIHLKKTQIHIGKSLIFYLLHFQIWVWWERCALFMGLVWTTCNFLTEAPLQMSALVPFQSSHSNSSLLIAFLCHLQLATAIATGTNLSHICLVQIALKSLYKFK